MERIFNSVNKKVKELLDKCGFELNPSLILLAESMVAREEFLEEDKKHFIQTHVKGWLDSQKKEKMDKLLMGITRINNVEECRKIRDLLENTGTCVTLKQAETIYHIISQHLAGCSSAYLDKFSDTQILFCIKDHIEFIDTENRL